MIRTDDSHGYIQTRVSRFSGTGFCRDDSDSVVTEEPLEIRLLQGGKTQNVAVTMRTPVNDRELALGFLLTEGFIKSPKDVDHVECDHVSNIITVALSDALPLIKLNSRNFFLSSSCGVCGKSSINEIFIRGNGIIRGSDTVDGSIILSLPEKMMESQDLFGITGGIHAAGIFDFKGNHIVTMEDVGRHNAVDKCVGYLFSHKLLDAGPFILQISGRGGFEILQKAAMARFPIVSSISAPSSLAIEVAETFGITLACFVRKGRFSVYAHPERIARQPA